MVEMFSQELEDEGRQSSKGNQLKWHSNGLWYKADYTGYEGLSEYMVSHLLAFSSLAQEEYVVYDLEEIKYKTQTYSGCKSKDFSNGCGVTTLERLFKNLYSVGLNKWIYSIQDHKERLKYIVDQVERITQIPEFGKYMVKLLTIDALFLNEDRHTHNISVLMKDNMKLELCPIYDNGASLLSDTSMDYPLGQDIYQLMSQAKSKTFCDNFEEQLDIAEELYGEQIHFHFDYNEVHELLESAEIYDLEIRKRVEAIIMEQRRKYSYLFK